MADSAELPPLDLEEFRHRGRLVVIVGPPGSGKTSTLRAVYEHVSSTDHEVLAFSRFPAGMQSFLEYLPRDAVVTKDVEQTIRTWCFAAATSKILLLDDVFPTGEPLFSAFEAFFLQNLMFNARHCNLYVFMTVQHIRQLTPQGRAQINYTILLPKMHDQPRGLNDELQRQGWRRNDVYANYLMKPCEAVIRRAFDEKCFSFPLSYCGSLKPAKVK